MVYLGSILPILPSPRPKTANAYLSILSTGKVSSEDPNGVDGGDAVDDLGVAGGGDEADAVQAVDEVRVDGRCLDSGCGSVGLENLSHN